MKLTKSLKHKLIIGCAILLVIAIVVSIVVVSSRSVQIRNFSYIADEQSFVEFGDDFDICIEGDSANLFVNSRNGAVALVSADGNTIFNSCSADASVYSLATVLAVRLRDGDGNTYTMNSSDNSVAFDSVSVKADDNGASVTFNIFPDEKRAEKGLGKADVFIKITLELSFENGAFKASVDVGDISLPEGFCLEKLSILPGLFSVNSGVAGDNYIIPDGCGAQIQLNAVNDEDYSLNLGVYGSDTSLYSYSAGAYLPYFAYVRGNCLVNAIITEGDALSDISFKKFSLGGGYLYNTFTVTTCGVVNEKYVQGESYEGRVTQIYNFTDEGADYNEVALQVRDNLIRRCYLSYGLSGQYTSLPVYINVIGSEDGREALTTYAQAAEITTMLGSKGINNIMLRFIGGGNSGLASVSDDSFDFSSALGGKDGLNSLADKLSEQGHSFYLDYNALIRKVNYSQSAVAVNSEIAKYAGLDSTDFSLCSMSESDKNISTAYKYLAEAENVNVCLNDASMVLYSDIDGSLTRQAVLYRLQSYVDSLNAVSNVVLSHPAVYLMENVNGVTSLPEAASTQNRNGVTVVPVLQMVLHGSVVYGTNPINVSALSSADALLKAVEYGAVPSFLFTHGDVNSLGYSAYVTETADIYERASETLTLLGKTISSHEVVASGVYRVTYEYSTMVYVNYNPSVVEVDGIMIPAKDFVII